jgi:hypothetical protein
MPKPQNGDASAGLAFFANRALRHPLGAHDQKDPGWTTTSASHSASTSSILWIVTNVPYGFPPVLEAAGISLGDMQNLLPTSAPCARAPGFPVNVVGFADLHAAFLNESRTRGSCLCLSAGNPGRCAYETPSRRFRTAADEGKRTPG